MNSSCPLQDSISSVEVLETMGNDLMVVNAARVSFAKESHEMSGADEKLVRYLARNGHISPFFHPMIQLRLKMPIFVAREWFRHTIGFARNEVSRRYVDDVPECFVPTHIRARDPKLKQGSKLEDVSDNEKVHEIMAQCSKDSMDTYKKLLELNVAPEVARMVLPQSMYTEFIETASLYAYARLCKLRLDPHAQKEIQEYAIALDKLFRPLFPISWAALMDST